MIKYFIAFVLICCSHQALSKEVICGWIDNPSPGNQWVTDSRGTYFIARQGAAQANGVDLIQPKEELGFVRKNGDYGYSCGCLVVDLATDYSKQIIKVYSYRQKKLDVCKGDRKLKSAGYN